MNIGYAAQKAAEVHLEACFNAADAEMDGEPVDWPETSGPFCGCTVCVVRETLFAAWPILEAHVRESS